MDSKSEIKPQLSICLAMTQMNQSVPKLNLLLAVDYSINKNPNFSDLWSLDATGGAYQLY